MTISPIIKLQDLSKQYHLYAHRHDRLKEAIHPLRRKYHTVFSALANINFNVYPGDFLGIMGINGSGKSTLLKILCGVLTPSSGNVEVKGRISAILELSAGYHPEFTGIENIYFQCNLQGMQKKEIDAILPQILEFADIGDFASQPVKLYSSGMMIRLAFAASIAVKPDVLIIDEAMAVGDIRFQQKCFARIKELQDAGVTILLVSHSPADIITHCSRAILLSHGRVLIDSTPAEVTSHYKKILSGVDIAFLEKVFKNKEKKAGSEEIPESLKEHNAFENQLIPFMAERSKEDNLLAHTAYNKYEYRWGEGGAKILDAMLYFSDDKPLPCPGDKIKVIMKVLFEATVSKPIFECSIKTKKGFEVYGSNSEINSQNISSEQIEAGEIAFIAFDIPCNLGPGEYFISLGVVGRYETGTVALDRRHDCLLLIVDGQANFYGYTDLEMKISRLY